MTVILPISDRLGHRRWILNPTMQQTGFGYAVSNSGAAYSSVYVFDYDYHNTDVTGCGMACNGDAEAVF